MAVNYVPFSEAVIEIVVELYRSTAKFPSVIHGHILQRIIHVCLLNCFDNGKFMLFVLDG